MESLARAIKSEKLDLVILNDAPPLLRHQVIKDGIILKDDRPRRVMFESRAVREYLDTAHLREVRCHYLKNKALRGGFLG
jgi:predicted nucleotidyltransferase